MKTFLIAFLMLVSVVTAYPTGTNWIQTFVENWTGGPTFSNWIIDAGTSYPGGAPQWGTGEVESYSAQAFSITHENYLAITPHLNPDGSWVSGRMETKQEFACAEGGRLWIEASIRLGNAPPSQMQGIWPAFWALGSQFRGNYQNWPMVSEWDILESINGLPTMYTTIHCGVAPGGPCNEFTGISSHTSFTKGTMHKVVFEVDRSMTGPGKTGTWLDETLTWMLDDAVVFQVKGATVNDQQAWTQLAAAPHFLLLNVAVGGSFPDAVAGTTTPTSATIAGSALGMEVKYVGVWNTAT